MAFIRYLDPVEPPSDQDVPERDNILRIHGVHAGVMRIHDDLYRALMHGPGPLGRVQREMVAVVVSGINRCRY